MASLLLFGPLLQGKEIEEVVSSCKELGEAHEDVVQVHCCVYFVYCKCTASVPHILQVLSLQCLSLYHCAPLSCQAAAADICDGS